MAAKHSAAFIHTQAYLPEHILSPFEVHQIASREIINKANGNYAGLPFTSKPFFLESFKTIFALAGLLTYPHFGRPSHSVNGTVAKHCQNVA
jgi:hypothetical protein